jgi:hypothetical protein
VSGPSVSAFIATAMVPQRCSDPSLQGSKLRFSAVAPQLRHLNPIRLPYRRAVPKTVPNGSIYVKKWSVESHDKTPCKWSERRDLNSGPLAPHLIFAAVPQDYVHSRGDTKAVSSRSSDRRTACQSIGPFWTQLARRLGGVSAEY